MVPHPPTTYRDLAESAWRWVQAQVREGDEGLWLPEHPGQRARPEHPFGMHSGIGGLAHTLADLRLVRPLTPAEHGLADGIAETVRRRVPTETEYDYFDGLARDRALETLVVAHRRIAIAVIAAGGIDAWRAGQGAAATRALETIASAAEGGAMTLSRLTVASSLLADLAAG